jgi:predicted phosphodiesterase
MRLQLISDLHTEFYHDKERDWSLEMCQRIEIVPDLDFLVIAGDLVVPARQRPEVVMGVFDFFRKKARHILYVEGNHEFYGGLGEATRNRLREVMPSNYTWLRNEHKNLDGIDFYGGAMWFPNADGLDMLYRDQINDWFQIDDLRYWVYSENRAFREGLKSCHQKTIVISHHLPSMMSVPQEYKFSHTNRFFVSNQEHEIWNYHPRLWLHGHTHQPCDYKIQDTRVVCNPYAYPLERRDQGPYPTVVLDV